MLLGSSVSALLLCIFLFRPDGQQMPAATSGVSQEEVKDPHVGSNLGAEAVERKSPQPSIQQNHMLSTTATVSHVANSNFSQVDAIFSSYEVGQPKTFDSAIFKDLENLEPGDRVQLSFPGFELRGAVNMASRDDAFHRFGVEIDDGLGVLSYTKRYDGAVAGRVFFTDESRALAFEGASSDDLHIERFAVSDLICAPVGATYPNAAGMAYQAPVYQRQVAQASAGVVQAAYNSLPGADYVIYIDFDGEEVSGTSWNADYNSGNTIIAPPHPLATFDEFVRAEWARVSEDYVGFEINVTTDRAVFNATDPAKRVMCVVTPDQSWLSDNIGTSGGVAFVGSFGFGDPCWGFLTDEQVCSIVVSHEVGHTLGLLHDGTPTEPYFEGHGGVGSTSWGPIMGAPYDKQVTQWSIGEYLGATQWRQDNIVAGQQDDLVVLTSNGFGFRADDTGNNTGASTILNTVGSLIQQEGLIETTADIDFYRFEATEVGQVVIQANALDVMSQTGEFLSFYPGANLALELKLYDSSGTELASDNPLIQTGASLIYDITATGNYYVSVQAVGRGNPLSGGFSDYGSIGQYTISGSLPTGPLTVRGGPVDQIILSGDPNPSEEDGRDLGRTDLRTRTTIFSDFKLENNSSGFIQINQITFDTAGFAVEFLSNPIGPGETGSVRLTYTPTNQVGVVQGTATIEYIELNDPGSTLTHLVVLEAFVFKTDLDDNYEENDTFDQAYLMPRNTFLSDILGPGTQADNDWYLLEVPPGFNEITVSARSSFFGGAYIALYDPRGYLIYPTDNEALSEFTRIVDPAGGSYRVRVFGENNRAQYDLFWSAVSPIVNDGAPEDSYETRGDESDNNRMDRATKIGAIRGNGTLQDIDGLASQRDPDWYKIPIPDTHNQITVSLTQLNFAGAISMRLYDSRGYPQTEEIFDGTLTFTPEFDWMEGYFLLVNGDDAGTLYDISYSSTYIPPVVIAEDSYEENDTWSKPNLTLLNRPNVLLSSVSGTGRQFDNDWYRFQSPQGYNILSVVFDPDGTAVESDDLILSLYDSRGYLVSQTTNPASGGVLTMRTELATGFYSLSVVGSRIGSEYDFSWSYSFAPPGDDVYEVNNTPASAFDLTGNEGRSLSELGGVGLQADADFYRVPISGNDQVIIVEFFDYDTRDGALEFYLTDIDGNPVALPFYFVDPTSSFSVRAKLRFTLSNPPGIGNTSDYFVLVRGEGRGNTYDFSWDVGPIDDNYEENDTTDEAYELPTSRSGDLESIDGLGIQEDADWYRLGVPFGSRSLAVSLLFDDSEGDIDLWVYNEQLRLIGSSFGIDDGERVEVDVDDEDAFFYILVDFADNGNEYNLLWSYDGVASGDADMDWIGDGWESQFVESIHSLSASMNDDGDTFPMWAEYALYLDPATVDAGIVSSFERDGYQFVSFKRNREAFDAGYSFNVIESGDVSFSQIGFAEYDGAVPMGEYDLVTYRSSVPIADQDSCFFKVVVERPEQAL